MEPWPYSFRQLTVMARAKQTQAWEHTAWIVSHIVAVNSTKRKRITPDDFNPLTRSQRKRKPSNLTDAKLDSFIGASNGK